jgi:hypothetical protein
MTPIQTGPIKKRKNSLATVLSGKRIKKERGVNEKSLS